jgi:hypothetical protein
MNGREVVETFKRNWGYRPWMSDVEALLSYISDLEAVAEAAERILQWFDSFGRVYGEYPSPYETDEPPWWTEERVPSVVGVIDNLRQALAKLDKGE